MSNSPRLCWTLALCLCALVGCGQAVPGGAMLKAGAQAAAASWDPNSTAMGDCPNFAQASNGRMMTVVSRETGRGAKAGALLELYYPHYSTDQLWDSYVGVSSGNKTQWAHDMHLVGQAMAPDTGRISSQFTAPGLALSIEDAVDPAHDVHLRHVTVTNQGPKPLSGAALTAYAFFTLNTLPGGDRLHYDPKARALVQSDQGVAMALAADVAPDAWQCGYANLPAGSAKDARQAAESNHLDDNNAAGPMVTGVNGAMRLPLPVLAPGASATLTLAYGAGSDEATALASAQGGLADGWQNVTGRDARYWGDWLSASRMPAGLDADALAVYRRALVTMGQLQADNGAVLAAATNTSPLYRFVWPRDGSLTSLALAQAGHVDRAKAFFEFCEHLQRGDGGFAVNYFPDGSRPLWEFGVSGDEHDEAGLFAWGIGQLTDATGDAGWGAARWPAVRKACDFLLTQQTGTGLLTTCRDLWELDTDGSWTFSNAAAWAGLQAGAKLARQAGDQPTAGRYDEAAQRLAAAINTRLVADGHFARGERKGAPDPTLELANLALGKTWLGLVPDNDPRLVSLAAQAEQRLTTPSGGVRRHEGDHYYGGQPWPVTTGWMALSQLGRGDVAGARNRFNVMTRYAKSTDSLMLGEQYDEGTHHWVSAFPLTWSEATYVRTALELGR